MRVADYIADFLVEHGIVDCFSVVGGGAMHLNDALGHKPGLKVTYNHHEQASAMAAEGYARRLGTPACVCVTSGPGGTNAITGVMGAWLDSIPMLIFSGQVKLAATISSTDVPVRQIGDQEFNIVDSVSCMTKYAVMVNDPRKIAYHLEKAFRLATSGRPGPVWLDVPLDVQSAQVSPDELSHYEDTDEVNFKCDPGDIELLLAKLSEAERPVVLAGGGIRTGHAYDRFLRVVDKLGVPVVTAWNAHDLLPDSHPLNCGRPGTLGTRGGNFVVQNADMLISFACRMNVRQISYNWENFAPLAYKVAIDIDEAELLKPTLSIDFPITADIADAFDTILENDRYQPKDRKDWIAWCRRANDLYPVVLPSYMQDHPINPYVFMSRLSDALPEGETTVASNGTACVCSFQAFTIKQDQRLYANSGCASMGYGLPAALGASVALGGERVICLEGDGSIMMNLQELQTVRTNNLNLKIFILNNDGYHSIRQTQANSFSGNYCGIGSDSGDLDFPEWGKIADAFNLPFRRLGSLSEMDQVIDWLLHTDGPAICEVLIDKTQFFAPKLSSKKLPDGSVVSPPLEDMYPFLSETEMQEMKWRD